jgi:hypothetical protein
MLQTEFAFTLPCGFVDERGTLHRDGMMRLSTALDEMEAMRDPRVRSNDAYLSIVLLSRVLVSIGDIAPVDPNMVERLFSADFVYLQELFVRLNDVGTSVIETACPTCGNHFALDLAQTTAG